MLKRLATATFTYDVLKWLPIAKFGTEYRAATFTYDVLKLGTSAAGCSGRRPATFTYDVLKYSGADRCSDRSALQPSHMMY